MSKRHDEYEERLIATLRWWIRLSEEHRDALPGTVVEQLKLAKRALERRRPA